MPKMLLPAADVPLVRWVQVGQEVSPSSPHLPVLLFLLLFASAVVIQVGG